METHNLQLTGGAYHRINDFMGAHVECTFVDNFRVRYELSFIPDNDICVVTLRCECGLSATLEVSGAMGQEIAEVNRKLDIPTNQRITNGDAVWEMQQV